MGLTNQLAEFSPNIACAAAPLHPLIRLRKTCYFLFFIFTAEYNVAFHKFKEALSSPPVLAPFDPVLQDYSNLAW